MFFPVSLQGPRNTYSAQKNNKEVDKHLLMKTELYHETQLRGSCIEFVLSVEYYFF